MHRRNIRPFLLLLMVITSLILTLTIFTGNRFSYEEEQTSTTTGPQSRAVSNASMQVLAPSQVIYHGGDGIYMINTKNMRDMSLLEGVNEAGFVNFRTIDQPITSREILSWAQNQGYVIHTFDNPMPLSIYSSLFENFTDDMAGLSFDYILFPENQENLIQFYNSQDMTLHEVQVTGDFITQMRENFDLEASDTRRVIPHFFANKLVYLPAEPVTIAYRDYLLERIPNNFFLDLLFEDRSEVNVRYLTNSIRYNDLYSEMQINEETDLLTFRREGVSDNSSTLTDLIDDSLTNLSYYENWTFGVHYEEVDTDNNVIAFRRYMDGYPIFGNYQEDLVEIGVQNDVLTYLQLNLSIAQTPIDPTQEDYNVTLDSDRKSVV